MSVLRIRGAGAGRRPAHRGEQIPVDVRGPRAAGDPHRGGGPGGGEDAVEVQGQFTVSLEDLRRTSEGVLPGLFG